MKTKIFFIIAFFLALTACQTVPPAGTTPDNLAVKMKSADYSRMKQVEAEAMATAEYYKAQADIFKAVTDPTAQVAMMMKQALDDETAPTNSNDVEIAKTQASVQKHQTWAGTVKSALGLGVAWKGLDTLSTLGKAAINKPSVEVNADNGSSVEGAIGEGNTYTRTEQVSGILTEEAEVNPITLGGGEAGEEDLPCSEVRPTLPGEEEVDANGDGLVCSDGQGGAFDN